MSSINMMHSSIEMFMDERVMHLLFGSIKEVFLSQKGVDKQISQSKQLAYVYL
ncbi:MAG: hypothetical protein ISEC1_P0175 [Thiomicrorhabdus sp.]|nr:MAG: hypothetical protein ISEC1_P0175 [Thiomicrorhabdus sp.]